LVIPKTTKTKIEHGVILEIEKVKEGLILKPYNPITEMKGLEKDRRFCLEVRPMSGLFFSSKSREEKLHKLSLRNWKPSLKVLSN